MRTYLVIAVMGLLLSASPSHAMRIENGDGGGGGGGGGTTPTAPTTPSSACTSSTPYCPGASCSNLGQTQMSADKANIIACLEPVAGSTSYVWKSMSTVTGTVLGKGRINVSNMYYLAGTEYCTGITFTPWNGSVTPNGNVTYDSGNDGHYNDWSVIFRDFNPTGGTATLCIDSGNASDAINSEYASYVIWGF